MFLKDGSHFSAMSSWTWLMQLCTNWSSVFVSGLNQNLSFGNWSSIMSPIIGQTWGLQSAATRSLLQRNTLPETKIAPENGWLEDAISLWDGLFSRAMLVSGMVINWLLTFSMFLGPSFLLFVGLENKMTQLWPLPSRLGFPSSYSLECKYCTRFKGTQPEGTSFFSLSTGGKG